ncbi:MAG: hypothetical protein ACSW8I_00950 [bacterium]
MATVRELLVCPEAIICLFCRYFFLWQDSNNQGLHLYAFLKGSKGRTSDTIYIALQN